MTTKKNVVLILVSIISLLLTALSITFIPFEKDAEAAIDWTGHSYTKFTPYSNGSEGGEVYSPIDHYVYLCYRYLFTDASIIGETNYNGGDDDEEYIHTPSGSVCLPDGITHEGSEHQGTNTGYDTRYRIEIFTNPNVYVRQGRIAPKNSSGFYVVDSYDYGINSTITSFKFGKVIGSNDRDSYFGTVEGSGAYDINMLYDLVLVYEYFINGNSVRVSAGSVADELAGGLGAATTVNPADYEREGYALEGFWTGENKTGTQVLDADGYFVNDYAYTPGATLYPGYTQEIYWTDESVWSAAGKNFNNYSLQGSGTEEDPYLIQSEWDLSFLSWTIYNDKVYGGSSNKVTSYGTNYFYSGITFKQTKDLDLSAYYWQPIGIIYIRKGTSFVRRHFSGNYDGGGHTVSGVYTPAGSSNDYSFQGLFGYVYGQSSTQLATIENVGVIDSFIQGYSSVGGIVGSAYNLVLDKCYNAASVNGIDSVSGIIGHANGDVIISNCYNTGYVSCSGEFYSNVGGVVGYTYNHTAINSCYNTGSVTGTGTCTGGVVGYAYSGSTIINCYNTGVVSGSSSVGGVAGGADGIVDNCYNTGSVSGSSDSLGGVVGYAFSATITNCYNTGSVSGSGANVGGIIGDVGRDSTITNCYNTGSVEGIDYVGGVIGIASTDSFGDITITNCFNIGFLSYGGYIGGVVGCTENDVIITSTYYGGSCEASIGGINGTDVDGQAEYLADLDVLAKTEEWYSADAVLEDGTLVWNEEYPWDFESVWAIYGETVNEGYPVFIRYWTDIYYTFDNYVFSGAGTQADPYLIETPQQLAYLSWTIYSGSAHNGQSITINGENYYYQNSYFRQTANIDLSAGYWQPIGIFSTRESSEIVNQYFAGNYDGNGYIITGINIPEDTEYSYQGLFGVVKGNITDASVTNVAIYNSNIHGLEYVGGIAGYVGANASVTNSFYQGGVYGSSSGGIVGQVEGGEVSSSGFEGDVSAGVSAIAGVISNGGLVDSSYGIAEAPAQSGIAMYGQIDGGTLQNSLSICHDGDVTSKNYIGSDFSEFVWLNTDSSPIPRSLTWIGSIWPGSVTVDMLSSSGWTEIVA